MNKNETGIFRNKTFKTKDYPIEKSECFTDCLKSDGAYSGLRGVTIKNEKCQKWSSVFIGGKESLRKGNRCYKHGNKAVCTTGNSTLEKCSIPNCEIIDEAKKVCIEIKETHSTFDAITGIWKKSRWERHFIGHVAMLFNERGHCEDSQVFGKDPDSYNIWIKNFFMACDHMKYVPKHNYIYKFENIISPQKYKVYLFATFDSQDISKIVVSNFKPIEDENICFDDCTGDKMYNGIQNRAKTGEQCDWNGSDNWCKGRNQAKCKIGDNFKKCETKLCKKKKAVYCLKVTLLQVREDSALIQWTEPASAYNIQIEQYLILVYKEKNDENHCMYAYIVGKNAKITNREADFTTSCIIIQRNISVEPLRLEISGLDKGHSYRVYVAASIDGDKISYFNKKIVFSTDCLVDCFVSNGFPNLRSGLTTGEKCYPWKLSNDRILRNRTSNFCYPEKNASYCINKNQKKVECSIPKCTTYNKHKPKCINIVKSIAGSTSISGEFSMKSLKEVIVLLHDENNVCVNAMINGQHSPQEYPMNTQALFISCRNMTHNKILNNTYKFQNLYTSHVYKIYIIGVDKRDHYTAIRISNVTTVVSALYYIDAITMTTFNQQQYLEWSNTKQIKKENFKSFLITVVKLPKGSCEGAFILTESKNDRIHKITKFFVSICKKKFVKPLSRSLIFDSLTQNVTYLISIKPMSNKPMLDHGNKQIKIKITEGFKDCRIKDAYKGMRSSTKTSKKCKPWSMHSNKNYQNMTSNFCRILSGYAFCSVGSDLLEECHIPLCKDLTKPGSEAFVKIIDDNTSGLDFISGRWKANKLRNKAYGYVVLLHSDFYECIEARIEGVFNANEYENEISNFYNSCKTVSYSKRLTLQFKFNNLLTFRAYYVYIFGTISKRETSKIVRKKFKTPMQPYCFEDCLMNYEYSGIRMTNKQLSNCINNKEFIIKFYDHNWCVRSGQMGTSCFIGTKNKTECVIQKCRTNYKDVFCPIVKYKVKYNSLKLEWKNPDTRMTHIKSYLILLHEIGEKQFCVKCIQIGKKHQVKLGKNILQLVEGCNQSEEVNEFKLHHTIDDLKLFMTYQVYVAAILDKDYLSFINKNTKFKVKRDQPICFQDCAEKNFKYFGLRSAAKSGKKCKNWKSLFSDTKGKRISNRCYAENDGVPICYTDINTKEECPVISCENIHDDANFCVNIKEIYSKDMDIIVKLENPKSNINHIGYVILLHNSKDECIESLVYGKMKLSDYPLEIRSFYISCQYKKSWSNMSFKFEHAKAFQKYFIYIFAVINSNKISNIRRITYTVPLPSNCFMDCYGNKKYKGIRMVTENNELCSSEDNRGWCQNKHNEKPWCMSENNTKVNCRVPKCSDSDKEPYCVKTKISQIKRGSFTIQWNMLKADQNFSYIVLLYENLACIQAKVFYPKIQDLADQIQDIFKPCSNTTSVETFETKAQFKNLKPFEHHKVYIVSIINKSHIGYTNEQTIQWDCIDDCLENNEYNGIRRLSVEGKKCIQPKLQNGTKTNACYKSKNKYICNIGESETQECLIPKCQKNAKKSSYCVEMKDFISTHNSIEGKWNSEHDLDHVGYVQLLHDENEKCRYAVVYGPLKPEEYDLVVQSFYMPCDTVEYLPFIPFEYSFENLLTEHIFTVYLFGTLSKNMTTNIKVVQQVTNLMKKFRDCQTNQYTGIRSATKTGKKCQSWSRFIQSVAYSKKPSNWCATKEHRSICFIGYGQVEECSIPKCLSSDLQGANHHVLLISNNFTSYSISGEWLPSSSGDFNVGYVIVLHNDHGLCIQSIVQGRRKPTEYNIEVKNFFISCQHEPIHSSKITYQYNFSNFEPDKVYSVYIFRILSAYSISKITHVTKNTEIMATGNSKDCFAHCKTQNRIYIGLKFYKGNIMACEKIVKYRNCVSTELRIVKLGFIEGSYSLNDDVIKKKGFIVLLYGEKQCHAAEIHGLSNESSKMFSGFYINCVKILRKEKIDYKFELMLRIRNDTHTLFVIPILDDRSYGYVTQVKLNIKYTIAPEEYKYAITRFTVFLILFVIGIYQVVKIPKATVSTDLNFKNKDQEDDATINLSPDPNKSPLYHMEKKQPLNESQNSRFLQNEITEFKDKEDVVKINLSSDSDPFPIYHMEKKQPLNESQNSRFLQNEITEFKEKKTEIQFVNHLMNREALAISRSTDVSDWFNTCIGTVTKTGSDADKPNN